MERLNYAIKQEIKELSVKCFWFWNDFYSFYSNVLGIEKYKLEILYPKLNSNKYIITEKILEDIKEECIDKLLSEFYNLKNPLGLDANPNYNEAKILLEYFKKNVGKDVLKEKENKERFKTIIEEKKLNDKKMIDKTSILSEIKIKFFEYSSLNEKKQDRGYWLEKVFFDLVGLENIEHKRPYKNTGEQIDGHIKFNSFDYLIEIKWTEEQLKQKEISEFEGKIQGKAQSTRGIIFSINGFSESAVNQVKKTNPKIFFLDSGDFISILEERKTLYDILLKREDNLVRLGKVYNEK